MRRDISIGVATALALIGAIAAVPRPSASAGVRPVPVGPALTIEEEAAIGWLASAPLAERLGGLVAADDTLAQRVASVGARLAGVASVKATPWRFSFNLVASDEPMSFALPGGQVFVSRGTLAPVGADENVVAAILAHQMAHVLARHAATELAAQRATRPLLASLQSSPVDDPRTAATALALVEASSLDPDAEPEADVLAARLLHEAGYDAAAEITVIHLRPAPAPMHGPEGNTMLREQRLAGLVKTLQ